MSGALTIYQQLGIAPNSPHGKKLRPFIENAKRYEWLRNSNDPHVFVFNPEAGRIDGENLDAIVDGGIRGA